MMMMMMMMMMLQMHCFLYQVLQCLGNSFPAYVPPMLRVCVCLFSAEVRISFGGFSETFRHSLQLTTIYQHPYTCIYSYVYICMSFVGFANANWIKVAERAESFRTQQSNVMFVLLVPRYGHCRVGKGFLKGPYGGPWGSLGVVLEGPWPSLGRPWADRRRPWGLCFCSDRFVMYTKETIVVL